MCKCSNKVLFREFNLSAMEQCEILRRYLIWKDRLLQEDGVSYDDVNNVVYSYENSIRRTIREVNKGMIKAIKK